MMTKKRSLEKVQPLLEEFKRELRRIYGSRLKRLIVYGSYARGEAGEGSDLDLLVVLDRVDDPLAEREGLSDVILDLSLRYGIVVSVLVASEASLERPSPLFLNLKREGITV